MLIAARTAPAVVSVNPAASCPDTWRGPSLAEIGTVVPSRGAASHPVVLTDRGAEPAVWGGTRPG